MDSQAYETLLDRFSTYIDNIQVEDLDYRTVIQHYAEVVNSNISKIYGLTFPVDEEEDETSGHHLRSFSGRLEVPSIKRDYDEEISVGSKTTSSLPLLSLLPIAIFLKPPIPFIFPQDRPGHRPVRHPYGNPNPVPVKFPLPTLVDEKEKKRKPAPNEKPIHIWEPAIWATYGLLALLAQKKLVEKTLRDLERENPWLLNIVKGVAITVAALAIFRAVRKIPNPIAKVIGYLGTIGIITTQATAEEKEHRANIMIAYGSELEKLDQIERAIKLKQLDEGSIKPYVEKEALASIDKNREWYDDNNWFHDLPGDWPTMRDLYFSPHPVPMEDAPEDLRKSTGGFGMASYYVMQPTYLYDDLIKTASAGDSAELRSSAGRKLNLITIAAEKFGKEAANIPQALHGEKRRPQLDLALKAGAFATLHGVTTYTGEEDYSLNTPSLTKEHLKMTSRIEDRTGVSLTPGLRSANPQLTPITQAQNLSRTSRIDTSDLYEAKRENTDLTKQINELLEDYILSKKSGDTEKRVLLNRILELTNEH